MCLGKVQASLMYFSQWKKFLQTKTMPSRTRQALQIIFPAGKENRSYTVAPLLTNVGYTGLKLHTSEWCVDSMCLNFQPRSTFFLRCREQPRVSLASELCLYMPNTNRVYIKDFPPTVTAEWTDTLSLSLSLSFPLAFLSSTSCPFLQFSSLSLSHLVLDAGWSVTLLCTHWPVAR